MPSLPDTYLTYQFIKRFTKPYEDWPAYKLGIIDSTGNILKKRKELSPEEDKAFGNYDRLILNLRKLVAKVPGGRTNLGIWAATALLLKEGESLDPENVDLLKELLDKEMSRVNHINLTERFTDLNEARRNPGNKFCQCGGNLHTIEHKSHYNEATDKIEWRKVRKCSNCHREQVIRPKARSAAQKAKHLATQALIDRLMKEEMGVASISAATPTNNVGAGKIAGTKEAGDDPPVRKKAASKYKRQNKKFADLPFARRKGANNG